MRIDECTHVGVSTIAPQRDRQGEHVKLIIADGLGGLGIELQPRRGHMFVCISQVSRRRDSPPCFIVFCAEHEADSVRLKIGAAGHGIVFDGLARETAGGELDLEYAACSNCGEPIADKDHVVCDTCLGRARAARHLAKRFS